MPRTPNRTSDKCGAKRKGKKGTCGNVAGYRTSHPGIGHCYECGGATPAGEVYAERIAAKRHLEEFGREVDIEPHQALLWAIRISAGEVEAAEERVRALEENELLETPEESVDRPAKGEYGLEEDSIRVSETKKLQRKLNEWIRIRNEAMDRMVRYSSAALKSGLEERLVRIAEVQGKLMAEAVQGILKDLGVLDHPKAAQVVRYHLTAISTKMQEES